MRRLRFVGLLPLVCLGGFLCAQSAEVHPVFSRLNSFGAFGEYSNSSSHILLGFAQQRKLLNFGASYGRRILLRPLVDLEYVAEVRPLMFESDPVVQATDVETSSKYPTQSYQYSYRPDQQCRPSLISTFSVTDTQGNTYTSVTTGTCGRQWTFGQGFSPAGLKVNLLPRHAIQPVITALGGYMFSAQAIPVNGAGSFNYTLEIGAGVELYRSRGTSDSRFGKRSVRAEYRYHHISNKNTALTNPGIDSGLLQVTYAFGR